MQDEAATETKKEEVPKSPNFFSKILGSLKDTRTKVASLAPKSPKKEKKKDELDVINNISFPCLSSHDASTGHSCQ